MNCVEFESAVESAVENRQRPVRQLFEHASTCAHCRTRLSLECQLDQVIESWRSALPADGFVDRVLAEVAKPGWDDDLDTIAVPLELEAPRIEDLGVASTLNRTVALAGSTVRIETSVHRSHRIALISVVACLLLVAATTSLLSTFQTGSANRPFAVTRMQPLTHDELAALDVSDTIAEVFSDLRSGYRDMASGTSVAARDLVDSIPEIAAPPMPDRDDLDLLPDSGDMKRLWRPIGRRVSTALGFLWQTVPSEIPAG